MANGNKENDGKYITLDNKLPGTKLSFGVSKISKSNFKVQENQASPKSISYNTNISIQKKSDRKLPSKLMNNSSISIGRSIDAPNDVSSLEEKKSTELPSIPGISMVNSSGLSISN